MEVEEAPWVGKRFTWYRPNGNAKSKLDRFLISPEWLSKWSASSQYTLKRSFSDHCPVMLKSQSIDWGPKPFRILDCWLKDQSFKKLVQQTWSNNNQGGWGGFVLKQKIKALKVSIKEWNKTHFGDTLRKYKFLVLLKYSNFCYGMFSNESFCFLSTLFVDLWLVDVGLIVWT